jgi:tetratricopeptide (TPR) repeat protein
VSEPARVQAPVSVPASAVLSRPALYAALALIAITVFVYLPVRNFGYVLYDDLEYVSGNANIQGAPLWQSVQFAFTTVRGGGWAPLTALSHVLDEQLFGADPGPQHVENVIFHVLNTLLLFGIMFRMTRTWKAPAFVAALFAVHPLHVEAVGWIAERKDLLTTFFLFLTIWVYISYTRSPGWLRYLTANLLFALGCLAKPMIITLPVLLLLLDVWPLSRVRIERGQTRQWLRLIYEKIPMLVIATAVAGMTVWTALSRGGVETAGTLSMSERFTNALVSYAAYIRDMLWPANLAPFYPHEAYPAWIVGVSLIVLAGITGLVLLNARSRPYFIVGWLWYVVMLGPVSGIIQAGSQARADRFTYVPLIGLFIMVAWGIPPMVERWEYRNTAIPTLAVVVVCACIGLSRRQVGYWENAFTLWEHALESTNGNYVAHNVLGFALADQGRIDEAIGHYREAISLQPNFAEAHANLGVALAKQGRLDEAIPEFQATVRLTPAVALAHYDLGFALATQGRLDEAIGQYSEAVRQDPEYVEAWTKRGDAYQLQNRLNDAVADYTEALRIQPAFPDALDNLGLALANQGKYDDAIVRYNDALRVRPDFAEAHNNLGSALTNEGKYTEAINQFNETLRLQPNNQLARENLAAVLELQRKGK